METLIRSLGLPKGDEDKEVDDLHDWETGLVNPMSYIPNGYMSTRVVSKKVFAKFADDSYAVLFVFED